MKKSLFRPGENIAIKVPPESFDETVRFYEETLGLPILDHTDPNSVMFDFGGKNLWVDSVNTMSQSEIWLDMETYNLDEAAKQLGQSGIIRRDEIETLPEDLKAFWIKAPAGTIHLVKETNSKD